MIFQLRTDNHITSNPDRETEVRTEVEEALKPLHGDRLRRVEVYLEDTNSHKGGVDIRCTIETHLAGLPAFVAEGRAAEVDQAVTAAVDHLLRVMEHRLGRIEDRAGHASAAGRQGY